MGVLARETEQSIAVVQQTVLWPKQDLETIEHQLRVAGKAKSIAIAIGLAPDWVVSCYQAGLVHDAGKIAVPSFILHKKGALNAVEMDIARSHCTTGFSLLGLYEIDERVRQGVLFHHERWNGSGYPLGLKREKIPPVASIVGLADSWDAMATRPKLTLDRSLNPEEIKQELRCPDLYDPLVVRACFLILEQPAREFRVAI